jgi:hypothetical protein
LAKIVQIKNSECLMKTARTILLAAVAAVGSSALSFAVDAVGSAPAPAAAPATQPANPQVQKMIDSLADDDPAIREAASNGLEKLGREALPQLKENADSENPEIRSRVRTLIRHAERRLPPAAPRRDGGFSSHSTRMSISNGRKTIDVDDNGYKIRIEQSDEGIKMNVTGEENGKEVTETYSAKDADQLKRDNPEAFALYDKYNGNGFQVRGFGGNGIQGNVQIQIQGGNGGVFINPNGGAQIGPGGFGGRRFIRPDPNQQPQQPLPEEAQKKIQEQLKQQDVPEEQRRIMEQLLERIQRQQQDVQEQVQKQLEDEKRKAVDDLKVPEREEKKDVEKKPEEKKDAK